MPLAWNPGRNPRGAGAYALLATPTGLWVGSDTNLIGDCEYRRAGIAFFPLAGGAPLASDAIPALPAGVYLGGRPVEPDYQQRALPGQRRRRRGRRRPTAGPDWTDDGGDVRQRRQHRRLEPGGHGPARTVPASTPSAIFDSERWDDGARDAAGPSRCRPARTVQVRLYFANRYDGTGQVGQRVFDVDINGTPGADQLRHRRRRRPPRPAR